MVRALINPGTLLALPLSMLRRPILSHSEDVELKHLPFPLPGYFRELSVNSLPGIVDENIHLYAFRSEIIIQFLQSSRHGYINGYEINLHRMVHPYFLFYGFQPFPAAGNQDKIQPKPASCRAKSAPMPLEAPVTRAVFPTRTRSMLMTAHHLSLLELISIQDGGLNLMKQFLRKLIGEQARVLHAELQIHGFPAQAPAPCFHRTVH